MNNKNYVELFRSFAKQKMEEYHTAEGEDVSAMSSVVNTTGTGQRSYRLDLEDEAGRLLLEASSDNYDDLNRLRTELHSETESFTNEWTSRQPGRTQS